MCYLWRRDFERGAKHCFKFIPVVVWDKQVFRYNLAIVCGTIKALLFSFVKNVKLVKGARVFTYNDGGVLKASPFIKSVIVKASAPFFAIVGNAVFIRNVAVDNRIGGDTDGFVVALKDGEASQCGHIL